MFNINFERLPYLLLSVIIAFTVHEFSHAFVATIFGDPTPRRQGRLTLNPTSHIDLFGLLFIIIVGFGWAKPVKVNYFYFEKPKLAGILTNLAGPLSNLIMSFLGFLMLIVVKSETIQTFFYVFFYMNALLCFFNLLPLPPLDGFNIIKDCLPKSEQHKISILEKYGTFIFLVVVFIPPINNIFITPIFNIYIPWLERLFFSSLNLFGLN